jgi:transketolase
LGRLIVWFDSNDITIDGSTSLTFGEDVAARFRAYGWQVVGPLNGHDRQAIEAALTECRTDETRPSLLVGRTRIAHGSPNFEGKSKSHGAPLGAEEVAEVKKRLGFDPEVRFHVPEPVREWFGEWASARAVDSTSWKERRDAYRSEHPAEARAWESALARELPPDLLDSPPAWPTGTKIATRKAGREVLQGVAKQVPNLIMGSADLFESNLTAVLDSGPVRAGDYTGRNVYYGIREHAMAAMVSGMVLHGGVRAVGSTFLVFSDYMRPSLRLAALMGIPVVHVFTHDSVYVGEDGPTHQPVEQLDALRAIPNVHVFRPADARETVQAWRYALRRSGGPTLLVLTRQALPVLERIGSPGGASSVSEAGVVWESEGGAPEIVLAASGSEVSLCHPAAEILSGEGIRSRVLSVPCLEAFEAASTEEREALLPESAKRLFVEAGTGLSWAPWMRAGDEFLGIRRFGASAPGDEVAGNFGLTSEEVAQLARKLVR